MIEANANVILELISNGLLAHYGGEQGTVYYANLQEFLEAATAGPLLAWKEMRHHKMDPGQKWLFKLDIEDYRNIPKCR
jgi:hypothetical protein